MKTLVNHASVIRLHGHVANVALLLWSALRSTLLQMIPCLVIGEPLCRMASRLPRASPLFCCKFYCVQTFEIHSFGAFGFTVFGLCRALGFKVLVLLGCLWFQTHHMFCHCAGLSASQHGPIRPHQESDPDEPELELESSELRDDELELEEPEELVGSDAASSWGLLTQAVIGASNSNNAQTSNHQRRSYQGPRKKIHFWQKSAIGPKFWRF